jgi:hypothetical protein
MFATDSRGTVGSLSLAFIEPAAAETDPLGSNSDFSERGSAAFLSPIWVATYEAGRSHPNVVRCCDHEG